MVRVTREADHLGCASHLPVPRPDSPSIPNMGAWSGDVLAAHVGGWVGCLRGIDCEPPGARYLVPAVEGEEHPSTAVQPGPRGDAAMTRKLPARLFLIILRDALGRFMRVRGTPKPRPVVRRRRRPAVRVEAVQLALF